uniref:uncharacterized protein LOC105353173 n=1 Tax=Fragaria vesca subsp. vesca TaxID=101020 RepID=UPI0005C98B9E|nr:PREDICTED: uncharacterized protein LOC105353173 [Fragaria vesca subsp. vesca]
MKGGFAQKTPMKERKQLPTNKVVNKVKKKFRSPVICKDFEELLRLMKRDRPVLKDIDPSACRVCAGSVDHIGRECPCLDRIPPGAVLGPLYDYVCNGCGKIGENCCSKGAYAVRRRCACPCDDHWYWERRCSKDWQRPDIIAELPSIEELEEKVMKKNNKVKDECQDEDDDYEDEYREGYPGYILYGDRKQKVKYPDLEEDKEELLRLMKRIRPVVEDIDPYVCPVCAGTVDHFARECPCLDRIPPGAELGPQYDKVCIGCGNIGEICCSKGAYAIRMKCCCGYGGHWYWEGRCPKDWRRPSIITQLPSIQELEEEVLKKKNKNKEEDEVMVNVRKDIKYVDEVMVEDDKNSIKEVPSTEQSLEKSLQACCFTGP